MCGLPVWCTCDAGSNRRVADMLVGYKTEQFWIGYPHKEMTVQLKVYYLLQASYWLQQTIILAAKIEKPRKDFKELVAHVSDAKNAG